LFTATPEELRNRLNSLPRLSLAALPTPLQPLEKLSALLGGPSLYIKREDLTGMAMGGNKIREFEYQIAQAVEAGCDVLVHSAGAQSNQSCMTAAVAAKLGLQAVIIGRKDAHAQRQGNLLLTELFGAEVFLPAPEQQNEMVAAKMAELRAAGHKPFHTSTDARVYRAIAYVDGALELLEQIEAGGLIPDALYLCSGAYTHVGLVVAFKALGIELRVVGISPAPRDDAQAAAGHVELAQECAQLLQLQLDFSAEDFESYAAFVGADYGVVTEGSREAIQLLAREEGLLLDPSYTGKAMSGLLAHVRAGWWRAGQTIIFMHTGGTPALFAYADELGLE
jgi:1-aminocyclopropane-1-carboxylate deaminase/D-cysteine desulfhydrase-like pyridoxal-dependent ACC family enzyme